jgi:hypothetical protein
MCVQGLIDFSQLNKKPFSVRNVSPEQVQGGVVVVLLAVNVRNHSMESSQPKLLNVFLDIFLFFLRHFHKTSANLHAHVKLLQRQEIPLGQVVEQRAAFHCSPLLTSDWLLRRVHRTATLAHARGNQRKPYFLNNRIGELGEPENLLIFLRLSFLNRHPEIF